MPLIALIGALIGGQSIGAILAGLSIADWISLAGTLLPLGEDAIKLMSALHPAFSAMGDKLLQGAGAEIAGQAAKAWISANADKAIELQPGIKGI